MEELNLSYEEALKQLKVIVEELERGDILLDDILKHYEKGQQLLKFCRDKLTAAEGKLIQVSADKESEISFKTAEQ